MEKCIYLGNLTPLYGNHLSEVILHLIIQGRAPKNVIKKYHYGELFLIKEYLLTCFDGMIFDVRTLKIVIMGIMEELKIDSHDLMKSEFTKSYGPAELTLLKDL